MAVNHLADTPPASTIFLDVTRDKEKDMAATARISIWTRDKNGIDSISDIKEFEVPQDKAKRRRMLMRRLGAIVDASAVEGGPSGLSIIFDDIA